MEIPSNPNKHNYLDLTLDSEDKEKREKLVNQMILNIFCLVNVINFLLLFYCNFMNSNNSPNSEQNSKYYLYFLTLISSISLCGLISIQILGDTNYIKELNLFLHDQTKNSNIILTQFSIFLFLHILSYALEFIFHDRKFISKSIYSISIYIISSFEFITRNFIFFLSTTNPNFQISHNLFKKVFYYIIIYEIFIFSIFDVYHNFFFNSLLNTLSLIISSYFYESYQNFKNESEIKLKEIEKNYQEILEKNKNELKSKSLYLAKSAHEFKNVIISIINACNKEFITSLKIESSSESENEMERKLLTSNYRLTRSSIKSGKTNLNINNETSNFISALCNYLLILIEDLNTFTQLESNISNPIFFNNSVNKDYSSPILSSDISGIKNNSMTRVDLLTTLEFCVNIFRSRQKFDSMKKNIKIISQFELGKTKKIICNETKLKQIVINLISNAYKFTLSGEILLNAKFVEEGENRRLIRISVSDTGVGIADSEKETLFTPFKTIERNQRYNTNGSGLGLMIVKELVGQLDSKLEFVSEMYKGSVFWFDLVDRNPIERVSSSRLSIYSKKEIFSISNMTDTVINDHNLMLTESQKNIIFDLNFAFDGSSNTITNVFNINNNGVISEKNISEENSTLINPKIRYSGSIIKTTGENEIKSENNNLNQISKNISKISSKRVVPKSKFSNKNNAYYLKTNQSRISNEHNLNNVKEDLNQDKNKIKIYSSSPGDAEKGLEGLECLENEFKYVNSFNNFNELNEDKNKDKSNKRKSNNSNLLYVNINRDKPKPKTRRSKSSVILIKELNDLNEKDNNYLNDYICSYSHSKFSMCNGTCRKFINNNINNVINNNNENIFINNKLENSFISINNNINFSSPKSTKKSHLRVMICDDDESISIPTGKLIKKICKEKNIDVTIMTSNNGIECLYTIYQEFINRKYVDILFIDETMPFIKGSLTTKVIKSMISDRQINSILIYAVTAYEDKEILKNISQNGCDGILHKPINRNVINKIFEVNFEYR